MGRIYSALDVRAFHRTLTVRYREPEPTNSLLSYQAYWQLCSFCFACEADGKINFNHIHIKLIFFYINIFNLQFFFLTGYDSWTWAEPNKAFCGNIWAGWRPPKGDATVHRQLRSTLCGMFVQPFFFISYYFLELNLMILVFISRRHITTSWWRDTETILQLT
jgi:hypothetical protein